MGRITSLSFRTTFIKFLSYFLEKNITYHLETLQEYRGNLQLKMNTIGLILRWSSIQ